MRAQLRSAPLILFSVISSLVNSVEAQQKSPTDVAGDWLLTIDYFNNPLELPVTFHKEGSGLAANYIGDTAHLSVTQTGNIIKMFNKDPDGSKTEYEGV